MCSHSTSAAENAQEVREMPEYQESIDAPAENAAEPESEASDYPSYATSIQKFTDFEHNIK